MIDRKYCCEAMGTCIKRGFIRYNFHSRYMLSFDADGFEEFMSIQYCPFCMAGLQRRTAADIMYNCDVCSKKDVENILKYNKISEICHDCKEKIFDGMRSK